MTTNKKLSPKKKVENKLVKTYTEQDVRDILKKGWASCDPKLLLKDASEMWSQYAAAKGQVRKKIGDELQTKLVNISSIAELENHYLISEVLNDDKFRTLAIEISNQLVAEYSCKTTTEKMLAETAAWAYCRMIEYSGKFSSALRLEFISSEKNSYFSMMSKEVDRASRQYITAISTLKQLKQPALSVTFKADNAFVAQNQQINAGIRDRNDDTPN